VLPFVVGALAAEAREAAAAATAGPVLVVRAADALESLAGGPAFLDTLLLAYIVRPPRCLSGQV
jgi:hypothetical protein